MANRFRKHANLTLDPAVASMLKALSDATGLPRARMVDAALRPALTARVAALTAEERVAFEEAMAVERAGKAAT